MIVKIISIVGLIINEADNVFAIIKYDNELLSSEPSIYFELPDEWRVASIPFEDSSDGYNYTYAFNTQNLLEEIKISPDILNLSKDVQTKGFEKISQSMAVEMAELNNYRVHVLNDSSRINYTLNNNTAYSYLAKGTDEEDNEKYLRIFIGLISGDTIFAVTYGNSITDFNTSKSHNTMNNFIGSIIAKNSSDISEREWKIYTSGKLDLSFQIPSTWEVYLKKNRFEPGPDLVSNNSITCIPSFTILRNEIMDGTQPYFDAKSLSNSVIDTWIEDPELIIVGHDRAHKIKGCDTAGFYMTIINPTGENHAKLILTVINDGKVYTLAYEDKASQFDSVENQRIINRIVNTFSFS